MLEISTTEVSGTSTLSVAFENGIVVRSHATGIFEQYSIPQVGEPMTEVILPAGYALPIEVPNGWILNSLQMGGDGSSGQNLADIDGSGCVDDADLLSVLVAFGNTGSSPADVNSDGVVGDADLLAVLFNFGVGC